MPFGSQTHQEDGSIVHFDEVYAQIIEPAILGANMAPLRADAERLGPDRVDDDVARDAYPGINALTLMHLSEPPDPRRHQIAPVVVYSAKQRAESRQADYWDHATVLEAALLNGDESEAVDALGKALAAPYERWQPESTLNNVRMIVRAARSRGDSREWHEVIERLSEAAAT